MTTPDIPAKLAAFLNSNRPFCCLKGSYHIIIKHRKLQVVKSHELQMGDIRLLQIEVEDFVKGLSPLQWTTLIQKVTQLSAISKIDLFTGKDIE